MLRSASSWLCLTLLLLACGDDDALAPDASAGDGDTDGADDAGPGTVGDRGDAPPSGQVELIPDCDRFSPLACTAGRECQLLVRRDVQTEQVVIYPGCVEPAARLRTEGDPCEAWGGFESPYELPGLRDEVYVDPCEPGLYCAPDLRTRGLSRCQRACSSGRTAEGYSPCGGGSYCWAPGESEQEILFQEVCYRSDDCDPADPAACGPDQGCFLRFNDSRDGALSICLPLPPDPLADGEVCGAVNDCQPGSSCWGPPGLPPDQWDQADYRCRRACGSPRPARDDDGGAGDVGGDPVGACPDGSTCAELTPSGVHADQISVDFGLCE